MSMEVEMEITGLALCFLEDDASGWTVLFPCDDVHNLSFRHRRGGIERDLHAAGAGDLRILVESTFETAYQPSRDDTDNIFNLNGTYAHDGRLVQRRVQGSSVDEVRMVVPYSELDGHRRSPKACYVQRQDFPGAPVFNVGRKCKMISLSFEVTADLIITVKDSAGGTVGNPIPITYEDGRSITLEFDNDCGRRCHGNDFLDFYKVVADRDNDTIKYAAGEITEVDDDRSLRDIDHKSPTYGNCDPSWSHPAPPGGGGLRDSGKNEDQETATQESSSK